MDQLPQLPQLPLQRNPDTDDVPIADTERWELLIAHRPLLMRVARRRTNNEADAEDCVSEALARAYEFRGLDTARAQAFLCTTVSRLAVDEHRRSARARTAAVRDWTRQPQQGGFEDRVLDRAEGGWLAGRLSDVRGRERALLEARMSGLTVAEYAAAAGIPIGAAENAWTRLRHKALRALAAAGSAAVAFRVALRRPAVVAAPSAVALALTGFMFPSGSAGGGPAPAGEAGPVAPTRLTESIAVAAVVPEGTEPPPAPAATAARPAARLAPTATSPVDRPSTLASVPRSDVPAVASLGGTRVERGNEDETFEESVMRCVQNVDLGDPLADPCDY